MLALGIRYLTGCAVATDVADRRRVEWPPHPGRVFMALAAAHFQTGEDTAERTALEWLEAQPPPQMHAPEHNDRLAVTQYVPVNDEPFFDPFKGATKKAPKRPPPPLQSAPGVIRRRNDRTFARAWLEDETVYLVWPDVEPEIHFAALERLCGKVTRIGHSASLVQMWASQAAPETSVNWVPDEAHATERFRVAGAGSLKYLERQFNQKEIDDFFQLKAVAADDSNRERRNAAKTTLREKFQNQTPVRLRPELSLSHGYAPPHDGAEPTACGTVFDPRLLVFELRRVDGPYRHLDLAATLQLTAGLRKSLLEHLGADAPEVLSGHHGEAPSERPHVAFLPLPFVGHVHAHGGILGVALAVPRELEAADRERLLRALAAVRREGLKLGALGRWALDRPEEGASRTGLRDRVWTGAPAGARQWGTVTPYVFDRHAKAKNKAAYERELRDAIRGSWQRVRQSSEVSVDVVVTTVSAHLGTPASHQFPRLARKDGSDCRHTHAVLIFDRPVVGPVLLGAGRYRGYGLCRPLETEG